MKRLLKVCLVAALINASVVFAEGIKPFSMASRKLIEQAHVNQPMVLAFWSIDCSYCLDELATLAALVNQHPKIKLVLVNVDGLSSSQEVLTSLKQKHLQSFENWQFAEADEERLRFSIDKNWYGELPRTYYYDALHQVKAFSGSPDMAWLNSWAARF